LTLEEMKNMIEAEEKESKTDEMAMA